MIWGKLSKFSELQFLHCKLEMIIVSTSQVHLAHSKQSLNVSIYCLLPIPCFLSAYATYIFIFYIYISVYKHVYIIHIYVYTHICHIHAHTGSFFTWKSGLNLSCTTPSISKKLSEELINALNKWWYNSSPFYAFCFEFWSRSSLLTYPTHHLKTIFHIIALMSSLLASEEETVIW